MESALITYHERCAIKPNQTECVCVCMYVCVCAHACVCVCMCITFCIIYAVVSFTIMV